MHKPESVEKVDMERRRERILLPEGRRDLPPALFELGVIKGHTNRIIAGLSHEVFSHDRRKHLIGFPGTSGKDFVIGAPILMLTTYCANGTGKGSPPQCTESSKRKLHSSRAASFLDKGPATSILEPHRSCKLTHPCSEELIRR